jgi:hypothetical protein
MICAHTHYEGSKPCGCTVTITISRDAAYNLAEGFPSDEAADAAQRALEETE